MLLNQSFPSMLSPRPYVYVLDIELLFFPFTYLVSILLLRIRVQYTATFESAWC